MPIINQLCRPIYDNLTKNAIASVRFYTQEAGNECCMEHNVYFLLAWSLEASQQAITC